MNLYNEGLQIISDIHSYREEVKCGSLILNMPDISEDEFTKTVVLYNNIQKLFSIISIPIFSDNRELNHKRYMKVSELKNRIMMWLKNAYAIIKAPSTLSDIELIDKYSRFGYIEFLNNVKNRNIGDIKKQLIENATKISGGVRKKNNNQIVFNQINDINTRISEFNESEIFVRRYLIDNISQKMVYNIEHFLDNTLNYNVLPLIDDEIIDKFKTINFDNEHNFERVIVDKLPTENLDFIEIYNNTLNNNILKNITVCQNTNNIRYVNVGENLISFIEYRTLAYSKTNDELIDKLQKSVNMFINNALLKSNQNINSNIELHLNNLIYSIFPTFKLLNILNDELKVNRIELPCKDEKEIDNLVTILTSVVKKTVLTSVLARPCFSIEQYLCYN